MALILEREIEANSSLGRCWKLLESGLPVCISGNTGYTRDEEGLF